MTVLEPRALAAGFVALLLNTALATTAASSRPARPALPGQEASPDRVMLRVIVAGSAEQARDLVDRLNRGEDFAALAKAESIDPTAAAGGLLGLVDLSTLRPFLRDALHGVAPGQLSQVVQIPTGFAVLKVVEEAAPVGTGMNAVPASSGNVKYMVDVSGLAEAETALQRFSKPIGWNQDPRAICEARTESLEFGQRTLEDFFWRERRAAGPSQPPSIRMDAHFNLGQLYAYRGRMDDAIDQYREAHRLTDDPAKRLRLEAALGIAYLHRSEMDNGVYHAPGERCLLPMPRQGYAKTRHSERAVEHFLNYLAQRPDEIAVRWLLNLAYMTLGRYPDDVPATYLIPPATFASADHDVGRFRDVAPQAGLNIFATAGGLIVDDFAGNGRFDVVTSNFDSCGPMHYFRNNGDGTFAERTSEVGLDGQLGGLNLVQADYNNDACTDILVLRGGWQAPQRNSLLRNNCDGTFTDVTGVSGLAHPATSTQTAAWADINNDGRLDLFVGNENRTSQLFLNQGDGTFDDISRAAGLDRVAFSKGVTAGDYDNDRFVDFYVFEPGWRQFPLSQQRRQHVHGVSAVGRRDGAGPQLRDLVLRLRQRRLDRSLRHQLLRLGRGVGPYVPPRSPQRLDDEALPKPRRRTVPGRHGGGRPRQGVHADGCQLRRHRQRRLPRHLSRNRQSFLRRARAERAPPQRPRHVVRRRHRLVWNRRAPQGARNRLRRPRQRRRSGNRRRVRRCGARRQPCATAVRKSRPRARLDWRQARGRPE